MVVPLVWFSRCGTLVATAEICVTQASAGYFASELEDILHVPVKEPLLRLVNRIGSPDRLSPAYIFTALPTL